MTRSIVHPSLRVIWIVITRASADMSPFFGRWIEVVMFQLATFDLCVILTDTNEQSEDGERVVSVHWEVDSPNGQDF